MLRNFYRNVLFDIAANFCCPFLGNKTTKPPDENVVAIRQIFLNFFKETFDGNQHINFWDAGLFGNVVKQM